MSISTSLIVIFIICFQNLVTFTHLVTRIITLKMMTRFIMDSLQISCLKYDLIDFIKASPMDLSAYLYLISIINYQLPRHHIYTQMYHLTRITFLAYLHSLHLYLYKIVLLFYQKKILLSFLYFVILSLLYLKFLLYFAFLYFSYLLNPFRVYNI